MSRRAGVADPPPNAKRLLVERDGRRCFYCGRRFNKRLKGATLDHFIPFSVWPTNALENLVLACEPCNHAKADTLPQALLRPAGVYLPGLVPIAA